MENHYGNLLKTTWKYGNENRRKMVGFYIMFVFANLVEMVEPALLALLLNTIQKGGDKIIQKSLVFLGLYASISLFFWVFHGPARVMERNTAFQIVKNYREQLFKVLSHLPLKWHKDHHSGLVMSRVEKASRALKDFADDSYIYIQTIVRFVVSLVAIFYLLPISGFIAFLMGVAVVLVIFRFDKIIVKNIREINELTHRADSVFYDYVTNVITVITLRLEKLAKHEVVKKIMKIYPTWRENNVVNEVKWFTISMGMALMNLAVLFLYIYGKISAGEIILIGSFVALFQYTNKFIHVFFELAWKYEQLVRYNTDLKTVDPILKAYNALVKKSPIEKIQDWEKIEINKLYFRYEDEENRVHNLNNINIELEKGKKIAFVGASGSGKSTMMSLIRGLNDVDKVQLKVDGREHKSLRVLSDVVTLMPQEPEIFANTIQYNVTAGIQHDKKDILKVCKLARFEEVLKRLPKGLKTDIKEKGVNLSGGEKQRLALARGIFAAKDSSIILLDEPTSSVDPSNEMEIYKNLFKTFSDCCIISSVHRLHLLQMFDVIYLFEGGHVTGVGSFSELLKTNSSFQKMWAVYWENVTKEEKV